MRLMATRGRFQSAMQTTHLMLYNIIIYVLWIHCTATGTLCTYRYRYFSLFLSYFSRIFINKVSDVHRGHVDSTYSREFRLPRRLRADTVYVYVINFMSKISNFLFRKHLERKLSNYYKI